MNCQVSIRPLARSSRRIAVGGLALMAAATAFTTGCAEDEGKGTLVIPVILGPDRDCAEVGVTEIRVSVADGEFSNVVDCADDRPREVRLEKVPAGKYDLLVEGKDGDYVTVMDNLADADRRVEALGDGASVEVAPATLTTSPAIFEITIDFLASTCVASGIKTFEVRAFDDQADQLLAYDLPCDDKTLGTVVVPDEARSLKGDQFADFTITPLDKSGMAVGTPVSPAMPFVPPGPGRTVSATLLDCNENGCPEVDVEITGF